MFIVIEILILILVPIRCKLLSNKDLDYKLIIIQAIYCTRVKR